MKRYHVLATLANVLGIAIAVVAGKLLAGGLDRLGMAPVLVFLVSATIIVVASQLLRIAIERLIDGWCWFRRHWLGDQYLEGLWVEQVLVDDELVGVGLLVIKSDSGGLRFSGEDFDLKGRSMGTFMSHSVFIDWPYVTFAYRAQRTMSQDPLSTGLSHLAFGESTIGPPARLTGHFIDEFKGIRHDLVGRKVEDERIMEEFSSPANRQECIALFPASQSETESSLKSMDTSANL